MLPTAMARSCSVQETRAGPEEGRSGPGDGVPCAAGEEYPGEGEQETPAAQATYLPAHRGEAYQGEDGVGHRERERHADDPGTSESA